MLFPLCTFNTSVFWSLHCVVRVLVHEVFVVCEGFPCNPLVKQSRWPRDGGRQ